jgi:hypothetical protein
MNTASTRTALTAGPRRALATMRDDLRQRRDVRASYRELEHALSAYSSRSEIGDLLATIARQDGPETQRVRRILARKLQDAATHRLAS